MLLFFLVVTESHFVGTKVSVVGIGHGGGKMRVRDIWARRDVGETTADSFTPPPVPPRDSGFYLLSPSE